MDALPMTEENDVTYASQTPGVMHACGHDSHVAMGLTIAKMLVAHKDEFAGTVKLIFQPAEEGLGGAERMVAEGVLDNPQPDYSLSLHVWNEEPIGAICVTPGPAMAGAEMFRVVITGKGAHGASPHFGHDPIVASAQIITTLQTIVSRNVDPLDTAVLSITSIHGGTAFNIIPPEVELKGTIRTYLPETRKRILARFEEVVKGVAESLECQAAIEITKITPPVINDAKLSSRMQKLVKDVLPEDTLKTDVRTMGSEDMAFMMDDIPGCYVFIGSSNVEKGLDAKHHNPKFDIDEDAMPRGAALITAAVLDLLSGE
jgi:amidohydrolase